MRTRVEKRQKGKTKDKRRKTKHQAVRANKYGQAGLKPDTLTPSMNDCPGRITSTMLSTSLPRKLDSSVGLAGNCLQPLSVISKLMHSASGLESNMAALSGVASVPQMLHA